MKRGAGDLPTYKKAMIQVAAYRRIRNAVNAVLNHFDLNATEWMILGVLYESATGMRITDIASVVDVEVPLVTRLSRALLKNGLIQAVPARRDRREKPLSLTQRGQRVISEVEQALTNSNRQLEAGLSKQDVSAYFATLGTFMRNAQKSN